MKKLSLLIGTICAMTLPAHAQEFTFGQGYESPSPIFDPTISGEDDNSLYVVDVPKTKEIYFLSFDKEELTENFRSSLNIPELDERNFRAIRINYIPSEGNYMFIGRFEDKQTKLYEYFAYKIDAQTGEAVTEKMVLFTEEEKSPDTPKSSSKASPDRTKYMLSIAVWDRKLRSYKSYKVFFNSSLEVLARVSSSDVISRLELGTTSLGMLDDFGSSYKLSGGKSKIIMSTTNANNDFEVSNSSIDIEGLEVGEAIGGGHTRFNADGDLCYVSFYHDEKGFIKGNTYLKFNTLSNEVETQNHTPFAEDDLEFFKTYRQVRKKDDATLTDRFSHSMKIYQDKGFSDIAMSSRGIYSGTAQYSLYLEHLLVSYLDEEGSAQWMNGTNYYQKYFYRGVFLMPFLQKSSAGYTLFGSQSVHAVKRHFGQCNFATDDQLHVMFYALRKNEKAERYEDLRPLESMSKGELKLCSFDFETGEQTTNWVNVGLEKEKIFPRTAYQSKDGTNTMYIFAGNHKTFRLGVFNPEI